MGQSESANVVPAENMTPAEAKENAELEAEMTEAERKARIRKCLAGRKSGFESPLLHKQNEEELAKLLDGRQLAAYQGADEGVDGEGCCSGVGESISACFNGPEDEQDGIDHKKIRRAMAGRKSAFEDDNAKFNENDPVDDAAPAN